MFSRKDLTGLRVKLKPYSEIVMEVTGAFTLFLLCCIVVALYLNFTKENPENDILQIAGNENSTETQNYKSEKSGGRFKRDSNYELQFKDKEEFLTYVETLNETDLEDCMQSKPTDRDRMLERDVIAYHDRHPNRSDFDAMVYSANKNKTSIFEVFCAFQRITYHDYAK